MQNTEREVESAADNTNNLINFGDSYIPLEGDSFEALHKGEKVRVLAVSDMIGRLQSETLVKIMSSDGSTLVSPRLSAVTPLGTTKTALQLVQDALGQWAV